MTTVGGISFIKLTCGLVWVMWLLTSDLCKSTVEDVLWHAAALVKGVLNVTTEDDDDGDPIPEWRDITEVHVARGESMIIPNEMLRAATVTTHTLARNGGKRHIVLPLSC